VVLAPEQVPIQSSFDTTAEIMSDEHADFDTGYRLTCFAPSDQIGHGIDPILTKRHLIAIRISSQTTLAPHIMEPSNIPSQPIILRPPNPVN